MSEHDPMNEMLTTIRLTAEFTPPGSDEVIPAGATGEPWYTEPEEGRPSCYEPGIRIGLSLYDTLFKSSKGIEKVGTVVGGSERGGGFPGEWCHFIEVRWDDEDEMSTVHPHNILRVPNSYRFQWRRHHQPPGYATCDMAAVIAGAEYTKLNRSYGATGWL